MISYAILMLAMHPEHQQRVFEEVKLIFPDKNMENYVNYEDLTNLEFTERIIKETMRLFPAVPVMARNATAPFDLSKLQLCFRPDGDRGCIELLLISMCHPCRWHSYTSRKCYGGGYHIDSSGREIVGPQRQEVRSGPFPARQLGEDAPVQLHPLQVSPLRVHFLRMLTG